MSYKFEDRGSYVISLNEQHSEEWHMLRKYRKCASEIAAMVGESQFSTPEEAALNISGVKPKVFDERSKRVMQHGTDTEGEAREWLQEYLREQMKENITIREVGVAIPKWDYTISASLDGEIYGENNLPNGAMIEIKCPQKLYYPLLEKIRNNREHSCNVKGCELCRNEEYKTHIYPHPYY